MKKKTRWLPLGFVILVVSSFLIHGSRASSARRTNPAAPNDSSSVTIGNGAAGSLALLRGYLAGVSDSSFQQQAPLAGTVQIFASDCTTPKTDFNLGETVCGKITDANFAQRRFSWIGAAGVSRQEGPTMTMNPDTNLFVLPATRISDLGGGTIVDNRTTWTLVDRSTSDSSVQGSATFLVHEPGHPAVDLQVFGSVSENAPMTQISYSGCVLNQVGPDAAQNAKFQMTIPNNTTFVSITPPNVNWTCAAPVGGTVICSRASLPIAGVSECFTLLLNINAGTPNQSQLTSKMTASNDFDETSPRTNVAVTSINVSTATTGPAIGYQVGALTISSESCAAANNVIDPGELVTVSLCAQNYGNTATGATLLGTLQAIGGVTNPSAPQTYGVIAAGGVVCKNFTFTAAGLQCGSIITPTVVFTEGATPRGTAVFGSPPVITGKDANGGISVCCTTSPTAAPDAISGTITETNGSPIGGVVITLDGAASRTTVTDSNGNYHFSNLESGQFYTVTPSLANYSFSPVSRSFSLVGDTTDAAFTGTADATQTANAVDTTEYFVRQHYLDFLGREPDQGGFEYWTGQINQCNGDANCVRNKRIDVSASFFASPEFQQTGSFIYELYAGALGRTPNYTEFMPDRSQVVGGPNLEAARVAFTDAFVQRPEFTAKYPLTLTRDQFVDALLQTMTTRSGADVSSLRDTMLSDYDTGGRSLAVRDAVQANAFAQAEYNKAFVLMEYFGYLRRNPDTGGYDFWLDVLSGREAGNYRGMVCAFLTSSEYQLRFSSVVTRSNAECGR